MFLSKDPVPGLNAYAYCDQNPINKIDPDGREPIFLATGALIMLIVDTAVDGYYLGVDTNNCLRNPTGENKAQLCVTAICAVTPYVNSTYFRAGYQLSKAIAKTATKSLGKTFTKNEIKALEKAIIGNAKAGKTVLGNYPTYKTMAEGMKANYLNVDPMLWKKLEKAGLDWKVNQAFLDAAMARGDEIILTGVKDTKSFLKEIKYLADKGYKKVTY